MTVLYVPTLPMSVNRWSRAWQARHRERNRLRDAVALACARSKPVPVRGPVRVCLTFYWPDRRHHDSDNACKYVLDALVHAGLIQDDGPPWLTETVLRSRLAPSPDRTGIVVQLHADDAPAWPLPVQRAKRSRPTTEPGGSETRSQAILGRQEHVSASGLLARTRIKRVTSR